MYLSGTRTRLLGDVIRLLASPLDAGSVRDALLDPLAELMRADYIASFVWDDASGRYRQGLCRRADPAHLARYEADLQQHDPLPPLLHARRVPTRTTDVMAQAELVRTEFFSTFMRAEGLYWGINAFAHDGRRDVGDLRIWRRRGSDNFDADEVALLRMLYPAITEALGRDAPTAPAQRVPSDPAAPSPRGHDDPDTLARRLMRRHGLSAREAQVAALVAAGHPDKAIARSLGIGFATVRTHLGNALRKTGHENRKALIRAVASGG